MKPTTATFPALALLAVLTALVSGCSPALRGPEERIRIAGVVEHGAAQPIEVEVYERCSPRLVLFERCPGRLLGAARIARPGPFLVQIESGPSEVSVVASRGVVGHETACAAEHRATSDLSKPLELELAPGPCPIPRPEPIHASARAPVTAF